MPFQFAGTTNSVRHAFQFALQVGRQARFGGLSGAQGHTRVKYQLQTSTMSLRNFIGHLAEAVFPTDTELSWRR